MLSRLGTGGRDGGACRCETAFDGDRLLVGATDCPGGSPAERAACRARVVDALTDRDADAVLVRDGGLERAYDGDGAALLVAAGRFVERAAVHDAAIADRARRDPLRAGREAAGRAGPVARIAAETGLAAGAARFDAYDEAFRPTVAPTVARSRVAVRPPAESALRDRRDLETGAVARVYETGDGPVYHLVPVGATLSPEAAATLSAARERLAAGEVGGGDRAPGRAVRAVAAADDPVETLAAVLAKHVRGLGVVEDCFADERVTDVFATAPVGRTRPRVRADGEAMVTNVRLTPRGAEALASRFRRTSGRAFSRASPTLDATARAGGRAVRVAGVADPVSAGVAFAFRAHDRAPLRLPALVENGTLAPGVAALCSLAVERGAAVLVAGSRGAGKTTLLGALLFELPPGVRTVVVEDTPELPVAALREAGRDVQALRVDRGDGDGPSVSPAHALRTALRLGDGALVVGEVRGEEAAALYEAMRVGAGDDAVLGTVHGEGAAAVRERVVSDLGVPASAFAATDLVVTCARTAAGRRVARVEELVGTGADAAFATLAAPDGSDASEEPDEAGRARLRDRAARGNSRLLGSLARPGEAYADALAVLRRRTARYERVRGDAGDVGAGSDRGGAGLDRGGVDSGRVGVDPPVETRSDEEGDR